MAKSRKLKRKEIVMAKAKENKNLYDVNRIICQICNRPFTSTNPFCVHLRKSHNMGCKDIL